jgi:hypothetical protein
MNQTNRARVLIDQKDCAAVGHINAEANVALIRNHTITTFEARVAGRHRIDYGNVVAVNLACADKFSVNQPNSASRLAMHLVEIFQHSCLVVRQLNSRNSPHKSVNTTEMIQRGKCFDR